MPRHKFTPPTVEQVRDYAKELKFDIDAQYFHDYYTARGWRLKNNRYMRDWKAALRLWYNRSLRERDKARKDYIRPSYATQRGKDKLTAKERYLRDLNEQPSEN